VHRAHNGSVCPFIVRLLDFIRWQGTKSINHFNLITIWSAITIRSSITIWSAIKI
jgi:hypothetical protein